MNNVNSEEILADSLGRCLGNDDFLKAFYRRFLESDAEIATLFQDSDLVKQQDMMASSLMAMISATDENWMNDQYLITLSKKHEGLGIKPEHFELWEKSLLETVKEFDDLFNKDVAEAWKDVIRRGKAFMSGKDS